MFDLKRFLTEHRTILREAEHGFDLTSFKPGGFQKVLQGLGIPVSQGTLVQSGSPVWAWAGPGIQIMTGNNPITGERSSRTIGNGEKDYASYMGLEGDAAKVKQAVALIKKHADEIKDESDTRDFI